MPVGTLSDAQKGVRSAYDHGHLPALDGVRGLAIAMVLALHILTSNPNTGEAFFDFMSSIRSSFWAGVDLFFALSGFLITGILVDSLHKEGYFRNFYARRVLRIFPLYYGVLLTLICVTHPLHLAWHGKQYILLSYTQNLGIFTKDYYGFTPARFINLNHFWSLAVEEQFYLVWPLIVFLVRDLRRLFFVAVSLSLGALIVRIVLASHGALPGTLYEFTPCRMDTLLTGSSLAILYRTRYRAMVLRYAPPVLLSLVAVLVCLAFPLGGLPSNAPIIETAGFTLTALGSTALIATALSRTLWVRFWAESRVMRFLGKYSYGIYVYHYSIDAAISLPARHWLFRTFHSKGLAVAVASLPVVTSTILIAFASYHLYEKRFLSLKRYFEPSAKTAPAEVIAT
jgi:peptidoglycan/LPS O-acetylase OafA/YrhL